uniref:Uncharacterized protein n=1 Tax=Gopherus agassizii TaxID=38772 RepID=A0A452HIF6_9SAUR
GAEEKYKPLSMCSYHPPYNESLEKRWAEAEHLAIHACLKLPKLPCWDHKEKLIQEGKYERTFHLLLTL